jgi:hypothetical protein
MQGSDGLPHCVDGVVAGPHGNLRQRKEDVGDEEDDDCS